MSSDPYSRVYWSVMSDEKFDGIREDVRLFGSWSLMLVVADMAWPAPAYVPPTVSRAAVASLAQAELIDLLAGGRFRVHGLDAERERRSSAGRIAGLASGRSRSVERPLNERSRTPRTETNLDKDEAKQSRAEAPRALPMERRDGLPHVTPTVLDAWLDTTGRTLLGSGAFAQDRIDDACRRHSEAKVVRAIYDARAGFDHIPDASAMTAAVRNLLDPFPDSKQSKQQDSERREAERSRRGVERTLRQTHEYGGHEAERHPRCPLCLEAVA